MMWRKTKKMTFVVKENGREIPVENGILFQITADGEVVVYDGAEAPYCALLSIRQAAGKLLEMMQDTMERKMEEVNRGIRTNDT